MAAAEDQRATSSLRRGLVALELVAQSGKDGVTVTEVAAQLALDKSSSSRILATLREAGYVRQDVNRRYFSTPRLSKLAHRRPGVLDLAGLARARLEQLHDQHDEAIHLAAVNGGEMLFLDYLQTSKAVRTEIPMVPRPIHEVAVGVAVLAAVEHGERSQLMRESLAAAHHRLSAAERKELSGQIELAQQRGWATIEHGDEVTRIAVALIDAEGSPVGGICLSGPSYRIDPMIKELARDTIAAAVEISASLR
ncbi:IclR family transcriptional regulator [Microlunatus parietis]|uniref:DNA-binding IclR family transcriptional regulator n=1 Tax=Microlunatus parietis TaxID=682979 RepID=A0A7Y9ICR2_9ACTN|nr:helix-turn-helix domain-containing protein [Microlunatus parietis]NYE74302.1 DNA-binding IclR family transcriptional regulator [Microlunatus parietis]